MRFAAPSVPKDRYPLRRTALISGLEKRLPIFLLLSFLVLMAWNVLNPPPPEEAESSTATESGAPTQAADLEGFAEEAGTESALVASEELEIPLSLGRQGEPGSYSMVFSNRGARLLSLRIGDYSMEMELEGGESADPETWVELLASVESDEGQTGSLFLEASSSARDLLTAPLAEVLWQHRILDPGTDHEVGIEFTYSAGTGILFRKRLVAREGYELRLELEIENQSAEGLSGPRQFVFTPALVVPPHGDEAFYQEPQALAAWTGKNGGVPEIESVAQAADDGDLTGSLPAPESTHLSFAGVHNKFFAFLVSPSTPQEAQTVIGARYRRVNDLDWLAANPGESAEDALRFVVCDLSMQLMVPAVGQKTTVGFDVFAGPKQRQILEAANPHYGEMINDDIGFFSGIANIITGILGFYHGIVGNWGWAIILMTLTVRALLFPLNRRAQTAMARFAKKMKRVQPMLDANKEKYKDDVKKQREEQAKIMQQEGAFPPLGGCLPMFLQFPVFIGLFQALRVHFDLRHQPFILWMKDLSMPDQLMRIDLNTHLPFIGTIEFLNILPLVMIGLWIAQHKVMPQPTTSDPKQDQTRKMMIAMQVFFAFLFYNYASGLALYMIMSSSFAIFESLVIKRLWPIDDKEQAPKKPSRFMAKMAELQKEQQRRLEAEQKRRQGGGGGGKGKGKGKGGKRK